LSVALTTKLVISPEVLCQEVNGEMVLLDLDSESYFGLDTTGTRIWQLLQSGLSKQKLIEKMLDEFDIDRETLELDVHELLAKLLDAGLVRFESSP
jgi:hypothetical protein